MATFNQTLSANAQKAIETCDPRVGDEWAQICAEIPIDLEIVAQETKALQRKREVKSAADLLRLALAYSVCDWSLRIVGAWAMVIGLGHLSDVAVRKRLRNALPFLGCIIGCWVARRQSQLVGRPVRVDIVDASVISKPGSHGTDWRLHVKFNLTIFGITTIELTDSSGGETLTRHPVQENETVVGDRAYGHRKGVGSVSAANGYFLTRIAWQNLPLETENGQEIDPIEWLKAQSQYPCERPAWVTTPKGRVKVRLIAQRLPKKKAEKARRRARKTSRKKGHTPSKETLFAAGYTILVTNLPSTEWTTEQVLVLYRFRWQIELLFKRLKSILNLDHLRAKDPVLAQVYLLGKLVAALLLDEWTVSLANDELAGWFRDTTRPVSLWRWMDLWAGVLRQAIRGTMTVSRIFACLPYLARYLRDAPRKRRQHAAYARRLSDVFCLPVDLFSSVQHDSSIA